MDAGGPSAGEDQKGLGSPTPKESTEENTALLPKSLFGGADPEVGAMVTMKVVAVHGDEVEVAPENAKEKAGEEMGEKGEESMAGAMSKIDQMGMQQ